MIVYNYVKHNNHFPCMITFCILFSGFILLATFLDCGVWYHVKDLKIYDEDINEEEIKADTVL